MITLYNNIIETINEEEQVFLDKNLQKPVFIDLYDSQPEAPDQFEFVCPALFIKYGTKWQQQANYRIGNVSIEVHVLLDSQDETSNLNEARRNEGLKKLTYYQCVIDVLEGLKSEGYSELVLEEENPVSTAFFDYQVLVFSCQRNAEIRRKNEAVDGTIESITITGNSKQKFQID